MFSVIVIGIFCGKTKIVSENAHNGTIRFVFREFTAVTFSFNLFHVLSPPQKKIITLKKYIEQTLSWARLKIIFKIDSIELSVSGTERLTVVTAPADGRARSVPVLSSVDLASRRERLRKQVEL